MAKKQTVKKKKDEPVKKVIPKKLIKPKLKKKDYGNQANVKNGSRNPQKSEKSKTDKKSTKKISQKLRPSNVLRKSVAKPFPVAKKKEVKKKQVSKPVVTTKKKAVKTVEKKKQVSKTVSISTPKKKPVKKKEVKKRRTKPLTDKQKDKQRISRNFQSRQKRAKEKAKKEKAKKRGRRYERKKKAVKKIAQKEKAKVESKKMAQKRKSFDKILKKFFKRRKKDVILIGRGAFKRVAGRVWLDYKDVPLKEIEQTIDEIILNYIEDGVLDILDESGQPIEVGKHSKIENFIFAQWGDDIFPWWDSLENFQSIMANRSWDYNMYIKIVDDQGHGVYIKTNSELEGKFWNLISHDRNHNNPPFDRGGSSFSVHVNYVEKQKVGDEYVFVFHVSDWLFPEGRWEDDLPSPAEIPAEGGAGEAPKGEGKPSKEPKAEKPAKEESKAKASDKEIELELQKEKTKEAEAKARERESISKSITDIRVMVERGDIDKATGQEMIKKLLGL